MDLSTIKHLKEVSDCETAEKYLKSGWVLVDTYTTAEDLTAVNDLTLRYVFGWTRDDEPVYPPKKYNFIN